MYLSKIYVYIYFTAFFAINQDVRKMFTFGGVLLLVIVSDQCYNKEKMKKEV